MIITNRLLAIDIFRGLAVAYMILGNTPGSWDYVFPVLQHAKWHGWTPTDLVFPFFLFIVGLAMAYSLSHYSDADRNKKIIRRSGLIFLFGLMLNGFPYTLEAFEHWRILGVLQRIAIVYGVVALLVNNLTHRQILYFLVINWLVYWAVLVLGAAGNEPFSLEHNVVRQFDLWFLGANHMWQGHGIAFDPEGVLSTWPALTTTLLGYCAGVWLKQLLPAQRIQRTPQAAMRETGLKMLGVGGALILAAYLLSAMGLPINKSLWTPSFVLLSGGWAFIILAILINLFPVSHTPKILSPVLAFGCNPLLAYIIADLWVRILYTVHITPAQDQTAYEWLFNQVFIHWGGPWLGSLSFAITHVLIIGLIMYGLYQKKVLFKV
ncbi:acyltransferase family protein [Zooshikella sp. RANM57]|uniref:acyltransferase family protein n=1 Tax=Zooshikella sp. RANM57 TaxID=3425863 RepID=UPI003D6F89D9